MTANNLPATKGNNNLPAERAAAVAYGLTQFQEICAERDSLAREVGRMKSDLAANAVTISSMESRFAEMESRVQTAMLVRDQAVADRAVYETLFISVLSQLRAFNIPAAPLVRARDENEINAEIGDA